MTTHLKHLVFFKFKVETSAAQIESIIQNFLALQQEIPQVLSIEYGTDVSTENLSQEFSHCFNLSFTDAVARDSYLIHPAHQKFVQLVDQYREKVFVFDYIA